MTKTKTKKSAEPKAAKLEAVDAPAIIISREDPEFKAIKKEMNALTAREAMENQNSKPVVSTGSLSLDWGCGRIDPILRTAGIPLRSFVEIFGSNGAGKSTTLWCMMAAMQARFPDCWMGLLLSEEPCFDLMSAYGVDTEKVLVFNCYEPLPDQEVKWRLAEERLDNLNSLTRSTKCKMAAVDSVKGLTSAMQIFEKGDPNKAKDRSFYDKETAVRAQMMEKFFNRQKVDNVNSTVVLLNQMSESIAEDFRIGADVKPKTPGGRRMEFECLYRINIESRALRDEKEHDIYKYKPQWGLEMIYHICKNRYSPQRGSRKVITQIEFDYNSFNHALEVLNAAAYLDIVDRSGNWFVFKGKDGKEKRCNGKDEAVAFLRSKPAYMSHLAKQIATRHCELHKNKKDERVLKAKYQLDKMAMEDDIWDVA